MDLFYECMGSISHGLKNYHQMIMWMSFFCFIFGVCYMFIISEHFNEDCGSLQCSIKSFMFLVLAVPNWRPQEVISSNLVLLVLCNSKTPIQRKNHPMIHLTHVSINYAITYANKIYRNQPNSSQKSKQNWLVLWSLCSIYVLLTYHCQRLPSNLSRFNVAHELIQSRIQEQELYF